MEITLTLTEQEVNYILESLGLRPFAEVQRLITKVAEEGQKQIEASLEPKPKLTKK